MRTLTLSGDPDQLPAAARALGSDLLPLADSTAVDKLVLTGDKSAELVQTFTTLGETVPTLKGIGQSQLDIPVLQSDFGTAISSLNIHLVGAYTPIPPELSAMLTYYWNNNLVKSRTLDGNFVQNQRRQVDTIIDDVIPIPAAQLLTTNTFTVRLNAVPSGEGGNAAAGPNGLPVGCTRELGFLPLEVGFDANSSTFAATPGQSVSPGFRRFPQSLNDVATVAFGDKDDNILTDAAIILSELQKLNRNQLDVKLVDVDDFVASKSPGLAVGLTPSQVEALGAPLPMAEYRVVKGQDTTFGAGVKAPFAALQAFEQNGRNVLLLSSYGGDNPSRDVGRVLQNQVADSLTAIKGGWYGVTGEPNDLYVLQADQGEPVFLNSEDVQSQRPSPLATTATGAPVMETYQEFLRYGLVIALLILNLAAVFVGVRHLRRRRTDSRESK